MSAIVAFVKTDNNYFWGTCHHQQETHSHNVAFSVAQAVSFIFYNEQQGVL